VVGAEAPLGFEVEVPLTGRVPDEPLLVTVVVDGDGGDVRDAIAFRPSEVPAEGVRTAGGPADLSSFQGRALAAARCPESRSDLGLTTIVFGLGGLLVVASYGLMVSRWWRGRGAA
jgi:hypothetical protein